MSWEWCGDWKMVVTGCVQRMLGSLKINAVRRFDAGTYLCRANNSVGQSPQTRVVSVDVLGVYASWFNCHALARQCLSSSLQITNRSFTYASPYLWNQLPSSFRQPHSVHCPPGSPHPTHITSSQSPSSLSPHITPSVFHSRLKTHLFHKSFPSWHFWFLPDCLHGSWTWTGLTGHWATGVLFLLVSSVYILLFLVTSYSAPTVRTFLVCHLSSLRTS